MNTLIGKPLNSLFSWYIEKRIKEINGFTSNPIITQENTLLQNLQKAKKTTIGRKYGFEYISNSEMYKKIVPLHNYSDLAFDIEQMKMGEKDVLWPGLIKWFAQSSGTSSGTVKHIPISKDSLLNCHYKGGKDLISLYYNENPNTKLFNGKHLIASGSLNTFTGNKKTIVGDLSAIIMQHLPWWCEWRRSPKGTAKLISNNWDDKLNYICKTSSRDDIHLVAGVPSWILMIIKKILSHHNATNIHEIWPNFELFFHGGVCIDPYIPMFNAVLGKPIQYYQNYNATEGYFGLQNENGVNDMLLMLDYGIYFEFIKKEDWSADQPKTLDLSEVAIGEPYEMVISTNGGLWRYRLKDTICFTNTFPFKIKVCGRTQQFLNGFGEEIMVDHLEKAIIKTQEKCSAVVKEFIVSPQFSYESKHQIGFHKWLIEFEIKPQNIHHFNEVLDLELQKINIDYAAKRKNNTPLSCLKIIEVKKGAFYEWMKKRGKLGGQHKVPRIDNSNNCVNEISQIII